jgi:hypothetical protein
MPAAIHRAGENGPEFIRAVFHKGRFRDAKAPERHEEATYSDGGKHILDITSVDAGAKQMEN